MRIKPLMPLIAAALLQACGEEPQVSPGEKPQPQKVSAAPAAPAVEEPVPANPFARPKRDVPPALNAAAAGKKAAVAKETPEEMEGGEFLPRAARQAATSLGGGQSSDETATAGAPHLPGATAPSGAGGFLPAGGEAGPQAGMEGTGSAGPVVNIFGAPAGPEAAASEPAATAADAQPEAGTGGATKTPAGTSAVAEKSGLDMSAQEVVDDILKNVDPPLTSPEEIEKARKELERIFGKG
ncbi:MAG TPA: hypothetical protein ENJ79_03055 [Gammaproteobacteria bacterium]|nr:hypothetical protein [Gammaproteobacteria bacterium]